MRTQSQGARRARRCLLLALLGLGLLAPALDAQARRFRRIRPPEEREPAATAVGEGAPALPTHGQCDKAAREIAARQGVPVKTIHTRLRRAFERLRDRLDRDYGGDHRSWAIAIVSLASARRARWLSSAALVGAGVWSSLKIPAALLLVAAAALVARESLGSDVVQRAQRGDVTAGRSPTT